ncbi:family 78 glycoside hydrolase catalytic domain [Mumia sp. ZJ1417]|uniref:family 78 glycoside hydrolase catalytic domain n=1 Tax=Mumia sp. ZJ1417 TaxID=2708082 RepID=UPI00141EEA26|nr:family 78 glycoside hydrolase catalytic domain [Mumia sp. ZJ1417]QMW64879.1 family 78 glycoside hydrolase catalytic domain [Mumia sp. ZJ1417]
MPKPASERRPLDRGRVAAALVVVLALLFPALNAAPAVGAAPTASPKGVKLVDLEVEKKPTPIGLDVEKPRFSWVISTKQRDVRQTSYRLRLATTEKRLTGNRTSWDSGTVRSQESANVAYDGPALDPATRYHWRVDVVTSAGKAGATSTFRTGLLGETDWAGSAWIGNERVAETDSLDPRGASWIWTPEATTPVAPAEPRAFRSTWDAPEGKTAISAEILLTADDLFRVWLNGSLLGETSGAENEWQQSHLYKVALRPDRNVLAVRTDNGPGSPAGLIAKIRTTWSDGSTTVTTTDTSWKASKQVTDGFQEPGFDDSAWAPAVVQAAYGSGPWGSGVRPPAKKTAPAPLLRKEFSVGKNLTAATLFVAAGGYADVSVNGAPISKDVLSPGFTDFDDRAQYVGTDLTDQLQPGKNALGVELGRGFYGMTGGNVWRWESPPWHDEPVTRAVLRLEYADGTTKNVVTDDSWTIHDGPTVFDDLFAGETYDARLVQDGFDEVGFDDAAWKHASEVDGPKGTLVNQRQQPIRVTESLPAEEITEPADGVYVVKFPRVLAGWVELTAKGAAGTTIKAQYGEKLKADGRPNFSNNGGFQSGFQTDRFILAGTGEKESWESQFSYKGFQYVEVTGWPGDEAPPLSAFTAKAVHTDAAETGSFESSSRIMNDVHRAVVDTLKNNIHGIPTDTPMFEKNGWTGDAAVGAEMFMMNLDVHELFAKWTTDMNDTRDAEGAPMVIAPSSGSWGEWGVAPPWHSAYVMIPWWLYQYGGDTRTLTHYYDGMKKYVDLEFGRSADGLVTNPRLGDWVSPEASPAGGNAPEDTRVSGTAYLYAMLTSMERSARFLGKDADADAFAKNAAVVKKTFNDRFLDRAAGSYRGNGDRGYRQTHNVLALAFGLAPDEATAKTAAASIVADVKDKGMHLNTGVLGTKYLLPVLTDHGYADIAYELATQTTYPSWGFMTENGGTSMWEHWALDARSRGHYFLGTVDDWYYHDVAGISPSEETGYRNVSIAPAVTDKMDWARASTKTPYGPVSNSWRRSGDRLTMDVDVPVGSTATVRIPAANALAVTEGGRAVADAEGVHDVSYAGGDVVVEVGSGSYAFVSDDQAGLVGDVKDRIGELRTSLRDVSGGRAAMLALARVAASGADASATAALAHARQDRDEKAADALVLAHHALKPLDHLIASAGLSDSDEQKVRAALEGARGATSVAVADLLELSFRATAPDTAVRPGDDVAVTVTASNGGRRQSSDITASAVELPDGWAAGKPVTLAKKLAPGEQKSTDLTVTVDEEQKPASVTASARVGFVVSGAHLAVSKRFTVGVASPVALDEVVVTPSEVRPGGEATVTTRVRNLGRVPVTGSVEVGVPKGWTVPEPVDVEVAAGGEETVSLSVAVPRDTERARAQHSLDVAFTRDGEKLATGSGTAVVVIDPSVADAIDHVDLGAASSEQAHGLTASSSSGTSNEAGLTRRYAGHLTPFSHFAFDLEIEPGKPFVLRAVETYDRAQTKRYKVYVDGEEVLLRTHQRTVGAGTETHEVVVPAALAAADGTVRVKFENQDDPAYYDPSIADVWSRPLG